ncbi:MAG: alpha/beta hydrolase [Bacteroidota bacterium]|nr:alpha/beta hydrolase [Bacteroidota bacterium]
MKSAQRLATNYLRAKFKLLSSVSKKKAAKKAFELFCSPQTRNIKKLPKIFEVAEELNFVFDKNIMHGYRWNHPSGRKVLILHGFESSVINFDWYVKPLVRKGYEVLAFDAPANGRSGGKMINALIYKNFILEIHKRYGPIQSYLAHSFGGLALTLALEDIKHGNDYRAVVVAPATESPTAINSFFNLLKLDDEVRIEFEKLILQVNNNPSEWYSVSRAIKNIKAKILWVHDEDDDTTPLTDALKVKEKNHPHIQFVITKGLGHSRIYRDNEVRKNIIEFI